MSNRGAVFHDIGDGSLIFNGYDDDYAGMISLLVHLRCRFRANGQDVWLVPLDDDVVPPDSDPPGEEDDQQDDQDQDEDATDAVAHGTGVPRSRAQ